MPQVIVCYYLMQGLTYEKVDLIFEINQNCSQLAQLHS